MILSFPAPFSLGPTFLFSFSYNLFLHFSYNIKLPSILVWKREMQINDRAATRQQHSQDGNWGPRCLSQLPSHVCVLCSDRLFAWRRAKVESRQEVKKRTLIWNYTGGLSSSWGWGRKCKGGNEIWNLPMEELSSFGERSREWRHKHGVLERANRQELLTVSRHNPPHGSRNSKAPASL